MTKLNMTALNIELTSWNNTKSNKNMTADLLNEIASVVGFDMKYLCENNNVAIGYAFEETDKSLIKKMLQLSKTKEGRSARCKKYDMSTVKVINKWFDIFCILAKHNGITCDEMKLQKIKMHKQTDYIILKKKLYEVHPDIESIAERCFFAPTNFFVEQVDLLNEYDKILFLEFVTAQAKLTVKQICGIYWCFTKTRKGISNQQSIDKLHKMTTDEKKIMIESAYRKACFKKTLGENQEYVATIEELAQIEGGEGKLQDKKRVKPLIKKMVAIMDKEAESILQESDYCTFNTTGENFDKKVVDVEKCFEESREVFRAAIDWYNELWCMRTFEPVDENNRTIIEMEYMFRFCNEMF